MAVIDVHAHWMPGFFAAAIGSVAAADTAFARRFQSLLNQDHLTDLPGILKGMDAAGVDVALLSVPPPAGALPSGRSGRPVAAQLNDALMEAVDAYPDRLRAVLSLPVADVAGACDEVRRWVGNGYVAGVSVAASTSDEGVDVVDLEPVYRICADHRLALFLHPALDEPSGLFGEWNLHSSIAAPTASTLGAVRLALSGLLDRLPGLTVVVPHLGGAVPFLFGRLTEQSTSPVTDHDLSYYLKQRLFYDTCAFHPPALRCALATVGVERLLLGSDHPFRGPFSRAVDDLTSQLVGGALDAVLGGNAEGFLRPPHR